MTTEIDPHQIIQTNDMYFGLFISNSIILTTNATSYSKGIQCTVIY